MDALGPRADEGRCKTTKSLGQLSDKLSRGCPNGETHPGSYRDTSITIEEVSGGTETSNYPEEKKAKAILLVAVSERGTAQTCMT